LKELNQEYSNIKYTAANNVLSKARLKGFGLTFVKFPAFALKLFFYQKTPSSTIPETSVFIVIGNHMLAMC